MIGKIQRVPLRQVWKHEAYDFTTWLVENVDVLNELLPIDVASAEREKAVGTFKLDIAAEDADGNIVVIENQLEKSNHDHLGKVLTYLTNLDAQTAIWIVSEPRPEHIQAIAWLNESSSASFFLVKVEAVKIGSSDPAPLMTLIVGPSEESREIGQQKQDQQERHVFRRSFWTKLLDHAQKKTQLHSSISPTRRSYIGISAGKRGLSYNYAIREHGTQVELYIDTGKSSDEVNLSIFNQLHRSSKAIEEAFGGKLSWEALESRRACRISYRIDGIGWRDPVEDHDPAIAETVDAMISLEKALKPYIRKLKK